MFFLNMVDYTMFSLLLSTWIFCVEPVILSHSYSLSFHGGGPWDFSDGPKSQIPLSLIGFDWDWDLASGLSICEGCLNFSNLKDIQSISLLRLSIRRPDHQYSNTAWGPVNSYIFLSISNIIGCESCEQSRIKAYAKFSFILIMFWALLEIAYRCL